MNKHQLNIAYAHLAPLLMGAGETSLIKNLARQLPERTPTRISSPLSVALASMMTSAPSAVAGHTYPLVKDKTKIQYGPNKASGHLGRKR